MLKKLAQIAHNLDLLGLTKEADVLTNVLLRVAQQEVGDLVEDDDSEAPYSFPGYGKRWNDLADIDVENPDFQSRMERDNPIAMQWWKSRRNENPGNRAKPTTHYMHGIPVRFGPGHSDMKPSEVARFLYPQNVLDENTDAVRKHFEKLTRGRKHRGTFNIDYASGKGPEEGESMEDYRARLAKPRRFIFDPDLLSDWAAETGREPSELPVFDYDSYQGLFNPASANYGDFEDKRSKMLAEGKGRGWLAGHAYRHLDPSQTFGFGVSPREVDETGHKKPNWYLRKK